MHDCVCEGEARVTKTLTDVDCIEIQPVNNILRVDGAPVCQVTVNESDGRVWLRFLDSDKHRSTARGDRFIEVPLDVFVNAIERCA